MPTHYQGSKSETRALNCYINLLRAADSIAARATKTLTKFDLTLPQFGVMEALFHLGDLSQRELGKKLLCSGGNMTVVIDNLESRGMLKRNDNPEDRRAFKVTLTTQGRRLVISALKSHVEEIEKIFSLLSVQESEDFRNLCRVVGKQNNNI